MFSLSLQISLKGLKRSFGVPFFTTMVTVTLKSCLPWTLFSSSARQWQKSKSTSTLLLVLVLFLNVSGEYWPSYQCFRAKLPLWLYELKKTSGKTAKPIFISLRLHSWPNLRAALERAGKSTSLKCLKWLVLNIIIEEKVSRWLILVFWNSKIFHRLIMSILGAYQHW